MDIKPVKMRPNEDVVAELEDALDLARKGEIRNVAIVSEMSFGDGTFTSWGLENNMVLLGLLERVKHRILAAIDEEHE